MTEMSKLLGSFWWVFYTLSFMTEIQKLFTNDRFNHSFRDSSRFVGCREWFYSWVPNYRPLYQKRGNNQSCANRQPFIPNNVFQVDTAKSTGTTGTTRQNCFFTAHEVEEGATATWVSHHGIANQHWFPFFKRTSSSKHACIVWSKATHLFNIFNRSCKNISIIDMLHVECSVVAGHEWMNRFYKTNHHWN